MKQRLEWMGSPAWQFWGTIVGILALIAGVWFFRLGQEIRELTVTLLVDTPLVSVASEAGALDELTVLYKGEQASSVRIVQIKIENTGNQEIRPEDFITPLRYIFEEGATIVDAEVLETVPKNLGLNVDWVENEAITPALLLNPRDRAVVRFVVVYGNVEVGREEDLATSFVVDARVAGISNVRLVGVLAETGGMIGQMNASVYLLLIATLLLFILLIASRLRIIKQGHIAVVQSFDQFGKLVEPGVHFLLPWETQVAEIQVAQRVVSELMIPGIFTKGGLGVSVMLSYEMELDLTKMMVDELYFDEQAREDQQIRIFRQILLEIIAEAPVPPPPSDPNKIDMLGLLHPLVGPQGKDVQEKLIIRAIGELAERGFVITPGSLTISGLRIPEEIGILLKELRRADFTGAALFEFTKRFREAGGDITDEILVQLFNAMRGNPVSIEGFPNADSAIQSENVSLVE